MRHVTGSKAHSMLCCSTLTILCLISHLIRRTVVIEAALPSEAIRNWPLISGNVTVTLDEAIKQYYESRTHLLHVRVQLEYSDSWQNEVIDHLTEVLVNSKQMAYIINVQNSDPSANVLYYHNIWYVDSYRALEKILPDLTRHSDRFAGFYMILMHLHYDPFNYLPVIERTLKRLFAMQIVYVNISVVNTAGQTVLYSYKPFQSGQCCCTTKPQIVNYFENGRFAEPELFPNKLKNFNGCKIHFLSHNVAPFFTLNSTQEHAGSGEAAQGIEAHMIKTMGAQLNFTPVFTVHPASLWGDVYENGTVTGPFALLSNRTVDVLMGYFTYEPRRALHFGESVPYFISPVVAVVNLKRNPKAISSSWLLDPLKPGTWACIVVTILIAVFLSKLASSRRRNKRWLIYAKNQPIWLDIFGASLGTARSAVDSRRSSMRFSIAVWCVGFLICGAAYQGKLYVAYNRTESPRALTLDELKYGNYTFIVRSSFEIGRLLEQGLRVTPDRLVRVRTNNENDVYEYMVNASGQVATFTAKMRVYYFMLNRGYYNDLHTLPETLGLRQICAYFRSHSYLIRPINEILYLLSSSGLLMKWYKNIEDDLLRKHSRLLLLEEQQRKPLCMTTFSPILIGLAIGLSCAVLGFLYELAKYQLKSYLDKRLKKLILSGNVQNVC